MINSGSINFIPVHSDYDLLTTLLRDQLNFTGMVVTDYQDLEKLEFFHHIVATYEEANLLGVEAGIDMSMVPLDVSFAIEVYSLYQKGLITEERISESAERIIQLKLDLGLFDAPYPSLSNPNLEKVGSLDDRAISLEIARECITLLKNSNNVLPLDINSLKKILVTGPGGNSVSVQNSGWSIHVWFFYCLLFSYRKIRLSKRKLFFNHIKMNFNYKLTETPVARSIR